MKIAYVAAALLVLLALLALWLWTPDQDRAALEAKYLNAPDDMRDSVRIAGLRLHVRDSGPKTAPAVILIHGFGSSLHTWDAWADALASEHRVIRFDLPGSGLSTPDPAGDYSDERSLQVLIALMDHLGLARASLVGHSIGGRIAWRFAAAYPDRIDKLVLVSPDGFASPDFEYGKAPVVPATVKLMRFVLPKPLLRMSLAPAYANPSLLTDERVTRYHDLMLGPGSRDALIARMEQTTLRDPLTFLHSIRAPTLLIWGESDAMIPFSNSADYVGALANVKLVALPGVGHLPQEEAADFSATAVRAFLE